MVRPEGTILVMDAETGIPLDGASVEVVRYRVGPPPPIVSKRWKKNTDVSGRASFTLKRRKEYVYPLMCHGVDQWGWEVRVNKQGYAGITVRWMIPRPMHKPKKVGRSVRRLTVKLKRCNGKCPPAKPPTGGPSPDASS